MTDNPNQEPKTVPIRPDSFTDDYGLLDVSMEDVVSLFIDKEKQRHKLAKDDESQQVDLVGYRSVPAGLVMTLDGNARRIGITRALLTRCLSHQIVSWVDSIDRIKEITGLFNIACDAAEEFGYPDLYDKMSPSYEFANSSPKQVSFRTIQWVKNKLYAVAHPLGIPAGALFIIGLCFSLSRAGAVSKGTVDKYLSTEVVKFTEHVDERSVWVCGFNDLVRRRAKKDGLDNTITR